MAPPEGRCVKAAVAQSGPRRCAASMRLVAQKQLLPLAPLMPCGNPTWSDDMPQTGDKIEGDAMGRRGRNPGVG